MSRFKQESFNCVGTQNIDRIFCDETFYTDISLKRPVNFFSRPANRISLNYSPGTKKYVVRSYYYLPAINRCIFREMKSCTEEELELLLKKINSV